MDGGGSKRHQNGAEEHEPDAILEGKKKRVKWTHDEVRLFLVFRHPRPSPTPCSKDEKLRTAVKMHNAKNWKKIAQFAFKGTKTDVQCLHRWQKVLDPRLVKGPWTKEVWITAHNKHLCATCHCNHCISPCHHEGG